MSGVHSPQRHRRMLMEIDQRNDAPFDGGESPSVPADRKMSDARTERRLTGPSIAPSGEARGYSSNEDELTTVAIWAPR